MGDFETAVDLYTQLVEAGDELATELAFCMNSLAWLQATCPEAACRDGAGAVENATRACELTAWNDYRLFDTLAAAYAEAGAFEMAMQWQTKALAAASDDEQADFRSRLDLYRAQRPCHETPRVP